jgi:hypothetical protein
MALSATASQGFELVRHVAHNEVIWVPGDPGDTVTRGDLLTFTGSEGVADLCAAAEAPYGVALETVVVPALSTGFPHSHPGGDDLLAPTDSAEAKCLIPMLPLVPVGTPVLKATFANQTDDVDVGTYTAATPSVVTAAVAGDDDANGSLLYVYGGAGAGQWNVVADTTASSNLLTLHRKFKTDIDTTSDIIYLPGHVDDNNGIGFFSRIDMEDEDNLDAAANGAPGGYFTVYLGANEVGAYLGNLMLPVIPAALQLFA